MQTEKKKKQPKSPCPSAIYTHRIAVPWYGFSAHFLFSDFVHKFLYFCVSCMVYWYARYAHLYPLPSIPTACNSFCQVFHLIVVLLPIVVRRNGSFRRDKRSCQENFNGTIVLWLVRLLARTHPKLISKLKALNYFFFLSMVYVCTMAVHTGVHMAST